MEHIGKQELWSFVDEAQQAKRIADNTVVREGSGHRVTSFFELATKVAELQFRNREHVLLFRGQNGDYPDAKGRTKLRPTIFRADPPRPMFQGWKS